MKQLIEYIGWRMAALACVIGCLVPAATVGALCTAVFLLSVEWR